MRTSIGPSWPCTTISSMFTRTSRMRAVPSSM